MIDPDITEDRKLNIKGLVIFLLLIVLIVGPISLAIYEDLNRPRKPYVAPTEDPWPFGYEREWKSGVGAAQAGLPPSVNPYAGLNISCARVWLDGYVSVKLTQHKPE